MVIVGNIAGHVTVAALDQHVGDGFGDMAAAGDGEQMRLTLALGDLDQRGIVKPARQRQQRTCDGDVVILRQRAHHGDRRIVHRRELLGKLGARLGLDLGDQLAEDVVEELDVVLVEARRTVDNRLVMRLQRIRPLLVRAVLQDLFQLRNEGGGGKHSIPQKKGLLPPREAQFSEEILKERLAFPRPPAGPEYLA